ncbi:xanthohumol 4-O-methyltransferase-like [Rutidosis leptorrhynchoides]|uniref:xanthohumol 4-O-methyltransferase-like n=1 Tax=Rutidosis leptorrhynchoides TaxID=125765 RepID=UPI003A996919
MNYQNGGDSEAMLRGQAQILQYIFGALDAMALRCCVELRIADIINHHGSPTTLSEIINGINSPSINVDGLERLMKFLVRRNIFDEKNGEKENLYSLNHCSTWLLCGTDVTLAPLVMLRTNPIIMTPAYVMSHSIKEGGTSFMRVHGAELFDFCQLNSEFNKVFNEGMACTARITTKAILSSYKNEFVGLKGCIVDVGGGNGILVSEIVKAYPHLKGVNFDLKHVISTAPVYNGVIHIAGDMFKAIPCAETIFMKWILHDWGDDDCVKIIKNCRKALSIENGKLVIVEAVQNLDEHDYFNDIRATFDLAMFSHFSSGRERSESQWKKLLAQGGFFRYNIIKIPAFQSIIEAFLK